MKKRLKISVLAGLFAMVLLAVPGKLVAFDDDAAANLFAGTFLLFFLGLCVAIYVFFAMALMTIANKTNTENAWLAWVPIANFFLVLSIAGKPAWWLILIFIPLVNLVILAITWMSFCEACGKNKLLGLLMFIPIANLVLLGVMAWGD